MTPELKDLVTYIVKRLVDNPDQVSVKEVRGEQNIILEVSTAKEDIGKVIGRNGRTIKALRILLNAACLKLGQRAILEVLR